MKYETPAGASRPITYRQLTAADIQPNMLDSFNRYQQIEKCWRNQNGKWTLVDLPHIADWDSEKKRNISTEFSKTLQKGGFLFAAFDGEQLIAFGLVKGEKLGKSHQYIKLEYLHVSCDYRGSGIGKKLFAMCVASAKSCI